MSQKQNEIVGCGHEHRDTCKNQYPEPFRNWQVNAWIRSKPARTGDFDGCPFPVELTPLAKHPLIQEKPVYIEKVLAYRLLSHLMFTHTLELGHVNEACRMMINGGGPVRLDAKQMQDVTKIYCDEGGHALFVDCLAEQVEQRFEVSRRVLRRPNFDRILCEVLQEYEGRLSEALIRLLFVSISETLVTKILYNIPRDPQVATLVREVIGDHAADEARHSVFFKWYFVGLWEKLSAREKELAGRLLPRFVWAFLSPDVECDNSALCALGFDANTAQRVLAETYAPDTVIQGVREAASPTLQIFRRAGVMECAPAKEALIQSHLDL